MTTPSSNGNTRNEANKLLRRCVCSSHAQVDSRGTWLPKKIVVTYFAMRSRPGFVSDVPVLEETFNISKIETGKIPAEQFVLNYTEPGTMIVDQASPKALSSPGGKLTYFIPATLADLDRQAAKNRSSGYFAWIVLGNIALVALVACFALIKFRAKSAI